MAFGSGWGKTGGRIAATALAGVSLLAINTALHAQPANAQPVVVQPAGVVNVLVPAGSLESGLLSLGRQTNLRMLYPSKLTAGKRTAGVSGQMSPQQAVTQLLAGTGLRASFTSRNTVQVFDPTAPVAAGALPAGAIPLDTIDVQGQSAWGPVDGFVATNTATGSKTEIPLKEIPQSISVVGRPQMEIQGATTVQEAVRYTPGVTADQQGPDTRRDFVMSRGFIAQSYLDGLRAPYSPTLTDARAEAYGLERVEVLRGPASVLYGQNAPGGILNMVSKRPTETPFGEVQLQGGSFDQLQGAFDLGGPLTKDGTFLYRLTGLVRDSGTQVDYVKDNRVFIAPALTWKPNADTSLTFLGQYSKDTGATVPQYLPVIGTVVSSPLGKIPRNRFVGEPGFNRLDREYYSIGYAFEHHFNNDWSVRQNLKYSDVNYKDSYIWGLGLPDADIGDYQNLRRWASKGPRRTGVFAIDNQLEGKFQTGVLSHKVLVGLDYSRTNMSTSFWSAGVPSINVYAPQYGAVIPDIPDTFSQAQKQDRLGIYAQDQIKLDKWLLTLGVRHDQVDSSTTDRLANTTATQNPAAWTWRAGLSYLFDNGFTPYISYSTSFDPVLDTSWNAQPFKPTTGQQYEAGIKYQPPGSNLFLSAAIFDLTQQNVTTPDLAHQCSVWADPNCGWFSTQTGEVRVRGLELEAKASIDKNIDVIASYTYLDTKVTKSNDPLVLGRRLVDTPDHQASLWGNYTFRDQTLGGLTLGAGVRYVGGRYGSETNVFELEAPYGTISSKLPSVVLFDASVKYDFGYLRPDLKGVSLIVNATNLFDKDYVSGCQSERSCFYGPARRVQATLNYRW